jgi:soluble lytic murein transglycosylase
MVRCSCSPDRTTKTLTKPNGNTPRSRTTRKPATLLVALACALALASAGAPPKAEPRAPASAAKVAPAEAAGEGSAAAALLLPSPALESTAAAPAAPVADDRLAEETGPELPPALLGPPIAEADLASPFTSANAKSALALLQKGQAAKALPLLGPNPKDAPTRWLRALALRAAGRPAEARRLFEQLVLAGGPLADRATHLAALSAQEAGEAAQAEQLFGQVSLRYVDADQALLERARLQMKLRPAGPAMAGLVEETLAPILEGRVRADVAAGHLLAGEAQQAAGNKEAARAHYRSAWVDHPLSGAAASAKQREQALGQGASAQPVQLERLVHRAELLLEANRNRDAIDQLSRLKLTPLCTLGCPGDRTAPALLKAALTVLLPRALPRDPEPSPEAIAQPPQDPADPLSCRARLDQGRALRKLRDYAKARGNLAPVVLRCADPDQRARALYLLAQMDTLSGNPAAGPLWEALGSRFPASSLADDALLSQAQVRHKAGDYPAERVLLERLVNQFPGADTRPEALFRLYWSHRAEGSGRQGLVWLDQLAARIDPEGAHEERARYWRARTLLEPLPGESEASRAASLEAARADLIWLMTERPLTYHGLLARSRVAELDPQLSARLEELETQGVSRGLASAQRLVLHLGALAQDPHLLAAIELLKLGLKAEAQRELAAVDRSPARAAGEAGLEPLILLADLFLRSGDPRSAHQVGRTDLRELLRRPLQPRALKAASLAYPLAFRDEIVKVTKAAGLHPDLLQALMREESALDPKALSTAGAIGLTQLMPATAQIVARQVGMRGFRTAQLQDPAVNIKLGGTYLGQMLRSMGHPAPAYAAYNAGPGAVGGWLRARGGLPMDAWVEEIPLDETRGYVKRCLRSYAAYQYLYGTGRGRLPKVSQQLAAR